MRTFIYADGFNLYYGALKGTAWKWLDLPTLQNSQLPNPIPGTTITKPARW